ncbi:hypothetical protein GUJ93_ZPchr0001g31275 [Zizania palustris]|uniref:Methyltransferase domain-containing protein n=1 Tax=Zizania palustris TaxID=103762 RepID=A0A8J5R845_ZIZPA|nr:hypothetical protein GUJ93_ZPchr0001g31275 [Zizania palustris]
MDVLVGWTKYLCSSKDLPRCSVLHIGTRSGQLLQQLAKQGFSDLTGIDYSEDAIEVARNVAIHDGVKVREKMMCTDEGTLDTVGFHPDGPVKRMMYWQSVAGLVSPGGILVITSCSRTKDELVQEVENFNQRKLGAWIVPSSQPLLSCITETNIYITITSDDFFCAQKTETTIHQSARQ